MKEIIFVNYFFSKSIESISTVITIRSSKRGSPKSSYKFSGANSLHYKDNFILWQRILVSQYDFHASFAHLFSTTSLRILVKKFASIPPLSVLPTFPISCSDNPVSKPICYSIIIVTNHSLSYKKINIYKAKINTADYT